MLGMNIDLPKNLLAETHFIASVFKDNNVWYRNKVEPGWFSNQDNRDLIKTISIVAQKGMPIDLQSVQQENSLPKNGISKLSDEFIEGFLTTNTILSNSDNNLKLVQETSIQRQLILAGSKIQDIAIDNGAVLEKLSQSLNVLSSIKFCTSENENILLNRSKDRMEKYRNRMQNPGANVDFPSQFENLNEILKGGFRRGEYVIIGADSSAGKTAISINFSLFNAERGLVGIFFSAEMGHDTIEDRMIANIANMDINNLMSGYNLRYELDKIDKANEKLEKYLENNLIVDFNDSITPSYVDARVTQCKLKFGRCDYVVVDYLQWMTSDNPKDKKGHESCVSVTKGMKSICKNQNITAYVLSQVSIDVNKDNEIRATSMADAPTQIQRDCDVMIGMVTEMYLEDKTRLIKVRVLKGRNSGIGDTHLKFVPHTMKFFDADPNEVLRLNEMEKRINNKKKSVADIIKEDTNPFEGQIQTFRKGGK